MPGIKALKLAAFGILIPFTAVAAGPGVEAAVRAHMECVWKNAAKMDDGRMDPKQLAQLLLPLCRAEHEAAMHLATPQASEEGIRELEFPHTLAAVFAYRGRVNGHAPNSN